MRNHLTIIVHTTVGQHRFSLSLVWIGLLVVSLSFAFGGVYYTSFSFTDSLRPSKTDSRSGQIRDGTKEPVVELNRSRQPASHMAPSRRRSGQDLQPELESLDDFFDPNAFVAQKGAPEDAATKGRRISDKSYSVKLTDTIPPNNRTVAHRTDISPPPVRGFSQVIFEMIPNGSPVEFKGINSAFGNRSHPTQGNQQFHPGVDLFADMRTPVKATADGVVEFAGFERNNSYGNLITIHHNYGFKTSYAHLADVWVKNGDFIRKGEIIGQSGNSGLSSGPHLHYEVRFVHRILDPTGFLSWDAKNFTAPFAEKQVAWQSLISQINRQSPTSVAVAVSPLRFAMSDNASRPM